MPGVVLPGGPIGLLGGMEGEMIRDALGKSVRLGDDTEEPEASSVGCNALSAVSIT